MARKTKSVNGDAVGSAANDSELTPSLGDIGVEVVSLAVENRVVESLNSGDRLYPSIVTRRPGRVAARTR